MPHDKETFMHEWFEEVWNKGDISAIDRLMSPEAIGHGLPQSEDEVMRGPTAFKPFVAQFKQAFPDLHIKVCETVCEGDLMAARCEVTGTHTGEGLGIAPTNRAISITGMTMARIKDGQIVEGWNNYDFQTLFAQIQAE